jgi:hypothetical protein
LPYLTKEEFMAEAPSERSIKEWMATFELLYADADSRRTPEAVWNAAIGHCNTMGESIRTMTLKKGLLTAAAHAFCWMCSFLNRCNPEREPSSVFTFEGCLSGVVALKYPDMCPHCLGKPCSCNTTAIEHKSDKAADYRKLLEERKAFRLVRYEGFSVARWQETFNSIFGNNVHQMTLESIGLHFLEEVGEVVTAIRHLRDLRGVLDKKVAGVDESYLQGLTTVEKIVGTHAKIKSKLPRLDSEEEKADFKRSCFINDDPLIWKWRLAEAKMAMIVEIGDTFSWYCSVLNKIKSISADNDMQLPPLEQRLREEYFVGGQPRCPTCGKSKCACLVCP